MRLIGARASTTGYLKIVTFPNLVHPDRQESIMKYRLKVQKPRREEAFEPFNLYFMVWDSYFKIAYDLRSNLTRPVQPSIT